MNSTKNARKTCPEERCNERLRNQTADVTLAGGLRLIQKSLVCPIHGTVTAKPVKYSTEEF